MFFEKKCKECGCWCQGHKLVCENCHKPLRKMRLRDRLKRMHRNDPFELNWFETSPTDAPILVFSKHVAKVVSYALLGVAALITLLIILATGIY